MPFSVAVSQTAFRHAIRYDSGV